MSVGHGLPLSHGTISGQPLHLTPSKSKKVSLEQTPIGAFTSGHLGSGQGSEIINFRLDIIASFQFLFLFFSIAMSVGN